MAKLSKLIAECVAIKQGNKEFALFYADYDAPGFKPWRAEIGNTSSAVSLGEAEAEFCGDGMTPKEAMIDLQTKLLTNERAN
ncbi:hypothetical protein [Pararhizobium qamdonense]|uniref:hypothetical protein n=1 Tax=Pararhizobium qamdonense TaxID=3031126 RepID=UPI0023E24CDB|nr:hypothetical protein [Pararhizobium qamdonense]